jgi:hypothetical protein
MASQGVNSFLTLRSIAEHTKELRFPNLLRPRVPASETATQELVNWGAQVYCFSWIRHFSTLLNGVVILKDAGNAPSAFIVARSVYELGAHAYYVKKHFKQHFDATNFEAAWNFLTPIATGSRYINEQQPETSEMFPTPAHIKKAINCFAEMLPEDAREGYSFLSEFCHPNMLAFQQYYRWLNPHEVGFADHEAQGMFGATTAASIMGLMAIQEMLCLTNERPIAATLRQILVALVEHEATSKATAATSKH